MPGLQDEVLSTFLGRLSEDNEVGDAVVIGLRDAFAGGKMPKAELLMQFVVECSGDSLT